MKYNEKDDVTNLPKELRNEALRITPSYQLNIFEKFFLSVIILNDHHLRVSIMKRWMHLMLLQTQICDQYPFRENV